MRTSSQAIARRKNLKILKASGDNRPLTRCVVTFGQYVYTCISLMDREKLKLYFKKIGLAGFLFFLIKGLIWLFIFMGGWKLFSRWLDG